MSHCASFDTPFGRMTAQIDAEGALTALGFGGDLWPSEGDPGRLEPVIGQIGEYFARTRTRFDLPLAPRGTEFQQRVWAELLRIPFGEHRTYGELAKALGVPGSSRAVGRANATNPIALVVPCHRVIGADGSLTGYAGGLDLKARLLEFERGTLF